MEVRADGCAGAPIAILPLAPAAARIRRVTRLRAPIAPRHGAADLCFTYTARGPNPFWAIDAVAARGGAMTAIVLGAPLAGWAAPLDEVPDPVFAERMMGDGLAIDPLEGMLVAPCDGEVIAVPRQPRMPSPCGSPTAPQC